MSGSKVLGLNSHCDVSDASTILCSLPSPTTDVSLSQTCKYITAHMPKDSTNIKEGVQQHCGDTKGPCPCSHCPSPVGMTSAHENEASPLLPLAAWAA
eukprot:147162-Amphidinium_carterae.2